MKIRWCQHRRWVWSLSFPADSVSNSCSPSQLTSSRVNEWTWTPKSSQTISFNDSQSKSTIGSTLKVLFRIPPGLSRILFARSQDLGQKYKLQLSLANEIGHDNLKRRNVSERESYRYIYVIKWECLLPLTILYFIAFPVASTVYWMLLNIIMWRMLLNMQLRWIR